MGAKAKSIKKANDVEVNEPEVLSPGDTQTQKQPIYDPEKLYTWKMDQIFSISGQEFGILLNTIRAKVNTPEALEYRRLFACNDVMEQVMARSVANGQAVERKEE